MDFGGTCGNGAITGQDRLRTGSLRRLRGLGDGRLRFGRILGHGLLQAIA